MANRMFVLPFPLKRLSVTGTLYKKGLEAAEFSAELEALIPGSVYVVDQSFATAMELKVGQILVRNLELTRRKRGAKYSPQQTAWVCYDNLFDAHRAMHRLRGRYEADEVPALQAWLNTSDEMVKMTWRMRVSDLSEQVAYQHSLSYEMLGRAQVKHHMRVRDPHKTKAVRGMTSALKLHDVRGRFNPHRLPLMLLSTDVEMWKRLYEARLIAERMDFRAVVLDMYTMRLFAQVDGACLDIEHVLAKAPFEAPRYPSSLNRLAALLRSRAAALQNVTLRPFGHVFAHAAIDLNEAATFIEKACGARDPVQLGYAEVALRRAYRAFATFKFAALQLREGLLLIDAFLSAKGEVRRESIVLLRVFIQKFLDRLHMNDDLTNEPRELHFRHPVLPRITARLEAVRDAFVLSLDANDPGDWRELLRLARQEFKQAQRPL